MNWKNAERFRDDFGRYTLEMCKFVNQMREVHTLKISEMRRYLRESLSLCFAWGIFTFLQLIILYIRL